MTEQKIPFSEEAEQALLGAVLTNPLTHLNIAAFLTPENFFFLRHSYIWAAMETLEKRGDPIDTVTVSQELRSVDQLAEIGGPAYLTQLIRNTPTSVHAETYGAMVLRASQRRQLSKAADDIKLLAVDESLSVNEIFEKSESRLLGITVAGKKQSETGIKSIVNGYMDSVEGLVADNENGRTPGIPTGYPSYDKVISGSFKQEVIVIAGPAKSGKSSLNLNVARNRAKLGFHVVIIITEMTKQAVTRKFVSMETGISVDTLKNGKFTPQQYSRFVEALSRIAQWKVNIVDDYTSLTPLDVRRELRRIAHEQPIDCVLIDGLWMMKSNRASNSRHEEVAQIMIALVEIAKKLNVPIDLVHQCNRAADGRRDPRPRLADLGESAGVERNAYTLVFLYRENYYKPDKRDANHNIEIIVAANRDGNTGIAELGFRKDSETYHEIKSVIVTLGQDQDRTSHDNRKDVYQ